MKTQIKPRNTFASAPALGRQNGHILTRRRHDRLPTAAAAADTCRRYSQSPSTCSAANKSISRVRASVCVCVVIIMAFYNILLSALIGK